MIGRQDVVLSLTDCSIAHADILSVLHGNCFEFAWTPEAFVELFGSPGVIGFICHIENIETPEPIGFILVRSAANEAEILTLGVLPEWRRQGVAVKFLRHISAKLAKSGVEQLFLEVSELNKPAIELYESEKFSEIGRRENYYRQSKGRSNALVFAKSLLT